MAEKMTFPRWPQFAPESLEDIQEPLKNGLVNYWTGPKGREFEDMFAKWMGAKMAISTSNGTSALHTALAALYIGPGDEVIVPGYTFIASHIYGDEVATCKVWQVIDVKPIKQ